MNPDSQRRFENLAAFFGLEHSEEDYETRRLRKVDQEYAQLIAEQPCNRDVDDEE